PYFDAVALIDPGDGGGGGGGGFGGGSGSGTLAGAGGAQFFFYLGTEDQPQDATMVAVDGADQVPAYRGVFYCMIVNLVTPTPETPNLTFEFDEGTHDLAVAITDYYKDAGARDSALDMSALSGEHFIGHVIDSMRPLSEILEPLQQWYNFDVLPIDGKIKAVKRGGSIVATIPESSLAAYEEDSEPPAGPVQIDYIDPSLLPRDLNVSYMDVAKDYHNATEPASRAVGLNQNPENLNFPVVAESDDAVSVGLRELYRRYIERPVQFTTGPEFHHLSPTDPVTLALSTISHRVRLTGKQAPPGGGLIQWKGVTEDVGVYTQTLQPGLTGFEPLLVDFPANSVFVIIDAPLLRPEDAGDGTQPVIYLAMCKRGTTRAWRGGAAFKEEITNEWQRQTNFTVNSTIGKVRSTLSDCSDPNVFDDTNTFIVDFWNEVTFESFAKGDLIKKANVNLFWIGVNGGQGEWVQAATASPVTPAAGYSTAYQFSTLLRGRFLSEYATSAHTTGEYCVLMDSTIKPRRCSLKELQTMRRWVGASVGQGIVEALTVSEIDFTLQGNSMKPPQPSGAKGTRDSAGSLLIELFGRTRIGGGLRSGQAGAPNEEEEQYFVQILNSGSQTLPNGKTRILPAIIGMAQAALLISDASPTSQFTYVTKNSLIVPNTAPASTAFKAVAAQTIDGPGNFIEATLHVDTFSGGISLMEFIPAGIPWKNPRQSVDEPLYIQLSDSLSSSLTLQIVEYGINKLTVSNAGNDLRIRIAFSGTEVRVYLNWTSQASIPIYVSPKAPQFPLRFLGYVFSGSSPSNASIKNIILTTLPYPKTIYSIDQQVEDFGGAQSSIQADIWQQSPIVGAGQKKRVTL
ncbi:MAG: phage tail protein, partial [Acidobacteriota bacterium]|nr:phage tail protein [Acidobacteriota bacterium]